MTPEEITRKIANGYWHEADWPMPCKFCGEYFPEHRESCIVMEAKRALRN